jgi:hypothetical protein
MNAKTAEKPATTGTSTTVEMSANNRMNVKKEV